MPHSTDTPWRDHLTEDERVTIEAAESAKETWRRLKQARAIIISRAVARAKLAGGGKG